VGADLITDEEIEALWQAVWEANRDCASGLSCTRIAFAYALLAREGERLIKQQTFYVNAPGDHGSVATRTIRKLLGVPAREETSG
jgi:hypothetical protein